MSAVIKQGAAAEPGHIRTLSRGMPSAGQRAPTPLDLAEAEIRQLQSRLEQRDADLAAAEAAAAIRFEDGRRQGQEEGRTAAEADHGVALSRLDAGIERASGLYEEALGNLERLAPAIARAGLQRLLGEAPDYEALVIQTIREHLSRLEHSAILTIEVSSEDFASDEALATLSAAAAAPKAKIETRGDLAPGECRFRLALGALEVGPAQQWRNLDQLLVDLSGGGGT